MSPVDAMSSMDEILITTKTEYRILLEMKLLMSEFQTGGIYIVPKKNNSLIFEGVYFARSGIFKNAIFRFVLILEKTFPYQKTPVLQLQTSIVHPLIADDTNIFDFSHAFPQWSESDHIYELLKYFKYSMENLEYCMSVPNPANVRAVEIYNSNRENFLTICSETVTKTMNEIFNADEEKQDENNFIFTFDKNIVDENLHEQIMEKMKNFNDLSLNDFTFSFERRG